MAPFLIPQKAGDRVTTDRRDAIPLARLARSGALAPISIPALEAEAIRALGRAREDARRDRNAATVRLNAFLRRHDSRYPGRAAWGSAHRRWLPEVICATPARRIVFPGYVRAVNAHAERLPRLEQERCAQVNAWRLAPVVEALQALRGVQCTVAIPIVAEQGNLTRSDHPRPRMIDWGLIPEPNLRAPFYSPLASGSHSNGQA